MSLGISVSEGIERIEDEFNDLNPRCDESYGVCQKQKKGREDSRARVVIYGPGTGARARAVKSSAF